jgi:hypothetical protein
MAIELDTHGSQRQIRFRDCERQFNPAQSKSRHAALNQAHDFAARLNAGHCGGSG